MAITAKFYSKFWQSAMNKELDLDSDALKFMLLTSSHTPNTNTHQYKSSLTNEVSGAGYTAGGVAVTGVTFGQSGSTISFDAADVSWTNATLTGGNAPRYGVLYDSSPGSDATRPLIILVDFGDSSYAPNNGTLSVAWNAAGIGSVTS